MRNFLHLRGPAGDVFVEAESIESAVDASDITNCKAKVRTRTGVEHWVEQTAANVMVMMEKAK